MAAGKHGSKSGGGFQFGFKITLLCFLCISLFHSGDAEPVPQMTFEEQCRAMQSYVSLQDNVPEEFGKLLGSAAAEEHRNRHVVKYKDGHACLGWGEIRDNTGCNLGLKDLNYDKINNGIDEAGGGKACENGKCFIPDQGFLPICGSGSSGSNPIQRNPSGSNPIQRNPIGSGDTTPKPKPSSSAAIQIKAGAGLIVSVMMVLIGFSCRQTTS